MIVVNLYGGPSAGKSTVALGLTHLLKMEHLEAEFANEYAKALTLEGRANILKRDQLYIFAKQHRKLQRLEEAGCRIAVTDCPLLLCCVYFGPGNRYPRSAFNSLVIGTHDTYENWNFFLKRDPQNPYQQFGRSQSLEEAEALDSMIRSTLRRMRVGYDVLVGDEEAVPTIFNAVMSRIEHNKEVA